LGSLFVDLRALWQHMFGMPALGALGAPNALKVMSSCLAFCGITIVKTEQNIFLDSCVILGAKVGDSFQVHVFGDPGKEIMPECSGCMCHKHHKHFFFKRFHFFYLFINLVSGGRVWGHMLVSFGDLGHFF